MENSRAPRSSGGRHFAGPRAPLYCSTSTFRKAFEQNCFLSPQASPDALLPPSPAWNPLPGCWQTLPQRIFLPRALHPGCGVCWGTSGCRRSRGRPTPLLVDRASP